MFAIGCTLVTFLGLSVSINDEPDDPFAVMQQRIETIIADAEPGVVSIVVSHKKYGETQQPETPGELGGYQPPNQPRNPFQAVTPNQSLDLSNPANVADHMTGSGIVLDEAGLILTNYHLIDQATKIYVRNSQGNGCYANIHAADARSDLAVLKLLEPLNGLHTAPFAKVQLEGANTNLRKGSWLIALGHPTVSAVGDGGPSAMWGTLSNIRRTVAIDTNSTTVSEESRTKALHEYGSLLQTDARTTLGCSGSALLNMNGELVGISAPLALVAGADTAGGYAIPFNETYRQIVEVLKQGREVEYGFLGITVDPNWRNGRGVRILNVTPGTPADKVKLVGNSPLSQSDVILSVDGKPIDSQDDLFLHLGAALAGSNVTMQILRNGQISTVTATMAKYNNEFPFVASVQPPAIHGLHVEYVSVLLMKMLQALDNRVATRGLPEGVLVEKLEPNSPAEKVLQPLLADSENWIITHVNGTAVDTPAKFVTEAMKQPTMTLKLIALSTNETRTVKLP